MFWQNTKINTNDGEKNGIAPIIISASRSTDIPAFYPKWFVERLKQGYVVWYNPFNQKPQYISFENTKVIVFWTKNPKPMIKYLDDIDKKGIKYYFHFTLNDYVKENLEPNVPTIIERIETFINLSEKIGKEKVIWRFDPLILTDVLTIDVLVERIHNIGERIHSYTTKLVFSFADIIRYRKVQNNLKKAGILYREFTDEEKNEFSMKLTDICKSWGISFSTCAEKINLNKYGIEHNKCVDDELIMKITNGDKDIKKLFGIDEYQPDMFGNYFHGNDLKDKGQRLECGCILSKDIGQYNTCPHLCVYCYANTSEKVVMKNINFINDLNESILMPNK